MDIASIVIALVLAALLLYLVVRLPLAIMGNLRAGHRFREGLGAALGDLRLSRMLRFLGIDPSAYLHQEPAIEIKHHMARCDACDAKSQCDQVLEADTQAGTDDLGFCANIEDLERIRGSR